MYSTALMSICGFVACVFALVAKRYDLAAISALLTVTNVRLFGAWMIVNAIRDEGKKLRVVVEKKEGEAEPRVEGP